jgi:hypothetical protein
VATVEEYKSAMNELAAASQAFQPYADFLKKLQGATSYSLNNFLEATFGMKSVSGRNGYGHDEKYRVDMSKWPSADDVSAAAQRLATAFNEAHRIHAELPKEDREYVKSPPGYPDIKYGH